MLIDFSNIHLILYRPHGVIMWREWKNSCVIEVVVCSLEELWEFEFTIYWSFYVLKGLSEMFSYIYY